MALIVKNTVTVSPDAFSGQNAQVISMGLVAGEAIPFASPCYISTADGKVYKSVTTAAIGTLTKCVGFSPKAYGIGDVVSLYGHGTIFPNYAVGTMVAGTYLYGSATAGSLSDVLVLVGDEPLAVAINSSDIVVL